MRAILALCVFAVPAFAHIKLTSPGNFQVTDSIGSPNKTEPCGGNGVATGVVTTVMAGSQLTVSWTEPIPHPGHFRIAIARNDADFRTPVPVLNANGTDCLSAPIESPVSYPTLVDGLFPHTSGMGPYTTTVTVPMMSCENCKLQVMQFMSSHVPGCFYFQCAVLRIVMPDAGQPMPDAGVDAGVDVDAGSGGGAGGGGGSTGGGSGATGGGTSGGTCGPASCAGCCVDGRCEPGDTEAACGLGGASCARCTGDPHAPDACVDGACVSPEPAGCGCTSAPMGALLFVGLALLALRRRARQ